MSRQRLGRVARRALFIGGSAAADFALSSLAMNETPATSALFAAIVPAAFGFMGIRSSKEWVQELVYLPPSFAAQAPINALAEKTMRQIECYLRDPDFHFDLPLAPAGTPFQRKVWQAISAIPRGQVLTYGAVAKAIGCGAPRAVGQACGANWFPLAIPCHRVTASGGLGGFSNHDDATGFHVGVKRWLLAHEGAQL